jgi:ribosome-binding protein aMBF1 (putative translation factor)
LVQVLSEARERLGWSQRRLCDELGEENNFIQRIEALERDMTAAEFAWIAKTLGLNPVDAYEDALRRAKWLR